MTRELAYKGGLDLYSFPTGIAALTFAFENPTEHRTVAVFEEELAHFKVFFVAVRPTPAIKKFHERIAEA